MKFKGPTTAKVILKKNKVGVAAPSNCKIHYKARVIKMGLSWHKDKHTDQWNITDISEKILMFIAH